MKIRTIVVLLILTSVAVADDGIQAPPGDPIRQCEQQAGLVDSDQQYDVAFYSCLETILFTKKPDNPVNPKMGIDDLLIILKSL